MSGWRQVMDDQLDLLRSYIGGAGQLYAQGFGESLIRSGARRDVAEAIATTEFRKLSIAEPFYVDPEMMDVLEAAAASFKPEPLHESDLVTLAGFAEFPRPMPMIDRHGKRAPFRAIGWMPFTSTDAEPAGGESEWSDSESGKPVTIHGLHLSLYSHVDDMADPEIDDYAVQWTPTEAANFRADVGSPYMLAHLMLWPFGEEVPDYHEHGEEAPLLIASQQSWWRAVQSFFRLTMQTIGDRFQQQAPRQARKRWSRTMGKPKDSPYITVIRLRRPKHHAEEGETAIEWQHRWIVSGHWRNQWFPSIGSHRQIWISGYVKGPEDKPLLIRKGRAFELVR